MFKISNNSIFLDNLYISKSDSPSSSGNGHKVYSQILNLSIYPNSAQIKILTTHFSQPEITGSFFFFKLGFYEDMQRTLSTNNLFHI